MVPINQDDITGKIIERWLAPPSPGLLALRHALAYRRPGLWVDSRSSPRSLILIREGDGRLEAFGEGAPEPAMEWLIKRGRPFSLLAPETWFVAVSDRIGAVDRVVVETWAMAIDPPPPPIPSRVATRRLALDDAIAFREVTPSWSLRGWGSYADMMEQGAAIGVPDRSGIAAMAWVFDRAGPYSALGVYTVPRYRNLGLARAAASAMIGEIAWDRGRIPLWSTPSDNLPSRHLAASLGFSLATEEVVLRWPPRLSG